MAKTIHFTIGEKAKIISQELTWTDGEQTKQISDQIARATDSLMFFDLGALARALKIIAKGKEK